MVLFLFLLLQQLPIEAQIPQGESAWIVCRVNSVLYPCEVFKEEDGIYIFIYSADKQDLYWVVRRNPDGSDEILWQTELPLRMPFYEVKNE